MDNAISYCFIPCLHLADPATFLASKSVLGTFENSLSIHSWENKTFLRIVLPL